MTRITKAALLTVATAILVGAASEAPALAAPSQTDYPANPLGKPGYYLTAHDEFNVSGATLTPQLWNTRYLPHWSDTVNEARYGIADGRLNLRIDRDTPAWDPARDGNTKISGIQTAERDWLHRWTNYPGNAHHEETKLQHIQRYGYFEIRAKVAKGGGLHSAWWMIGAQQDIDSATGATRQNGELDIFEILGRDTTRGLFNWHRWNDTSTREQSTTFDAGVDLSAAYHVYGLEWTPSQMKLYLDNVLIKTIDQSPDYPMLTMLGLYEKSDPGSWTGPFDPAVPYPKTFSIDYFRAYQKTPTAPYSLELDDAALYGSARSAAVGNATGGRAVRQLGQGYANRAVLDELHAPAAGERALTLRYASAEPRDITYRINGGAPVTIALPGTGGWTTFATKTFTAQLAAGSNTIEFYNPSGWAPDVDTLSMN